MAAADAATSSARIRCSIRSNRSLANLRKVRRGFALRTLDLSCKRGDRSASLGPLCIETRLQSGASDILQARPLRSVHSPDASFLGMRISSAIFCIERSISVRSRLSCGKTVRSARGFVT